MGVEQIGRRQEVPSKGRIMYGFNFSKPRLDRSPFFACRPSFANTNAGPNRVLLSHMRLVSPHSPFINWRSSGAVDVPDHREWFNSNLGTFDTFAAKVSASSRPSRDWTYCLERTNAKDASALVSAPQPISGGCYASTTRLLASKHRHWWPIMGGVSPDLLRWEDVSVPIFNLLPLL